MSEHTDTKRRLKEIPLVSEFEALLNLCTLDEEDKDIMRMIYLDNQNVGYIADKLHCSERKIKRRHKQALQKIAKAL